MIELLAREVVVIDDDAAVLDSFRFMLQAAGVHVATYPSAVDYLRNVQRPSGCLILDQHMPCMTGLELAEKLRADGFGLPILLVTSAISPSIIARAAELGVARVIEKPPSEDDILRFVAACV